MRRAVRDRGGVMGLKRVGEYLAWSVMILSMGSCSKSDTVDQIKKYLARNIHFGEISAEAADSIDQITKILASNVLFETTSGSTISAADVQSVLEQLTPVLSQAIVGTWDVISYGDQCDEEPGVVTFGSDGSDTLVSGVFLAGQLGTCTDFTGVSLSAHSYTVLGNNLLRFNATQVSPSIETKKIGQIFNLTPRSFTMVADGIAYIFTKQ